MTDDRPSTNDDRCADEGRSLLAYYSRRAYEYEAIHRKPERQGELEVLRGELPALLAGAELLEIACGTGYWTEVIAPHVTSIFATDRSPEVLEVAQSKRYPPERVRFARADAFVLDGVDGRFTAAFAGFWWSHVRKCELRGFLAGLHARLVPGSSVVFLDNRYVEGSSTPISRTDADGNSYQLRTLADGSTHEVLKNFPSADELRDSLAGIAADPIIIELTHYWYLSYRSPEP
jgi:SAM-dependent methyltransferase